MVRDRLCPIGGDITHSDTIRRSPSVRSTVHSACGTERDITTHDEYNSGQLGFLIVPLRIAEQLLPSVILICPHKRVLWT